MWFNHSAFNCRKSLLIICSKLTKVMSEQCLAAMSISLFFRIKLFKVIHSVEKKISWFFFVKLSYTLSAFDLHKINTITSKQLSTKRYSNVIVLLCTVETERVKSRTNFQSIQSLIQSLPRRSSTPAASRTKFLLTTVNG